MECDICGQTPEAEIRPMTGSKQFRAANNSITDRNVMRLKLIVSCDCDAFVAEEWDYEGPEIPDNWI